jgi:Icc-related predicted phosphoesterase
MRLLLIADTEHPALDEFLDRNRFGHIDAIIACGDLPEHYLDRVITTFRCPGFYVRGNHDINVNAPGWTNLHGRFVKLGPLRLVGYEGCRHYSPNKRVQYTDAQMWRIVLKTLLGWWWRKPDIVVTHAPPLGIHDGTDAAHIGFKPFRWLLERFQPPFWLHGHQHLAYNPLMNRIDKVGATTLINADGYYILEV